MKDRVIYTGVGGYDMDRENANKYLTIGSEYKVVGGEMNRNSSEFTLEGVTGSFNTVMFDEDDDFDWGILTNNYILVSSLHEEN